jgi:hypothetical protein
MQLISVTVVRGSRLLLTVAELKRLKPTAEISGLGWQTVSSELEITLLPGRVHRRHE